MERIVSAAARPRHRNSMECVIKSQSRARAARNAARSIASRKEVSHHRQR
jgi:hypothetical protein